MYDNFVYVYECVYVYVCMCACIYLWMHLYLMHVWLGNNFTYLLLKNSNSLSRLLQSNIC